MHKNTTQIRVMILFLIVMNADKYRKIFTNDFDERCDANDLLDKFMSRHDEIQFNLNKCLHKCLSIVEGFLIFATFYSNYVCQYDFAIGDVCRKWPATMSGKISHRISLHTLFETQITQIG